MSLYLWINILIIILPLLLSFGKKLRFYTQWKTLFPSILIIGSFFVAWDIYFTDIGIWSYNPAYLSGVMFFNIPIEECLFLFTIPYTFVFIYEGVKSYFTNFRPVRFSYYFALLFTVATIVLAIIYRVNYFTFSTLIGAGIINWVVYFGFTPRWYPYFIIALLLVQIPLLVVDGLLSGVAIDSSVIVYNENEIIGFGIFSIPLEKFFYNFILLFLVVIVHEYLRNLWEQKTKST